MTLGLGGSVAEDAPLVTEETDKFANVSESSSVGEHQLLCF